MQKGRWEIVTHRRAHLEEQAAVAFLRDLGRDMYPGIHNASVRYVDGDNASVETGPRTITIGVGDPGCGPLTFNEHNLPGADGKCAADLVAEYLGIQDDPAIFRLLSELRRADRTHDVRDTELPTIVKRWYWVARPDQHDSVVNSGIGTIRDVVRFLRQGLDTKSPMLSLRDIAEDFMTRRWKEVPGNEAEEQRINRPVARVARYLLEAHEKPESVRLLEVASILLIWQALYRDRPKDVMAWTRQLLDAYLNISRAYFRCYDAAQSRIVWRNHVAPWGDPMRFAFINSGDPCEPIVARNMGAAVVIIRGSKGNVQVQTNDRFGLDLSAVTAHVRMEEAHRRGRSVTNRDFGHWSRPENIPEVPEWYYLKAGEMLLNGSDQSSQGVPPTVLDMQAFVDIVRHNLRQKLGVVAGPDEMAMTA